MLPASSTWSAGVLPQLVLPLLLPLPPPLLLPVVPLLLPVVPLLLPVVPLLLPVVPLLLPLLVPSAPESFPPNVLPLLLLHAVAAKPPATDIPAAPNTQAKVRMFIDVRLSCSNPAIGAPEDPLFREPGASYQGSCTKSRDFVQSIFLFTMNGDASVSRGSRADADTATLARRAHVRLAGQAPAFGVVAKYVKDIELFVAGGLEQIGPFQDVDTAGPAARAATRERHGALRSSQRSTRRAPSGTSTSTLGASVDSKTMRGIAPSPYRFSSAIACSARGTCSNARAVGP